MYRIDENTSIDESLVTCAEYQLFIDEMRAHGEQRQPDHWLSYQFTTGQSRAAILGIRSSDAKAFCYWLTQREGGVWRYRIPTSVEAAEYPLPSSRFSPLGYWTTGPDDQENFAWVGSIPANPRDIDIAHDLVVARDLERGRKLDRALNRDRNLARALEHAINLARDLALNLDFDHASTNNPDTALDGELNQYLATNRDLIRGPDLVSDYALTHDTERGRALAHARDRALDLARINRTNRENFLRIYIDFYTLQERIVGRSPAFEGLRLVKERNVSD